MAGAPASWPASAPPEHARYERLGLLGVGGMGRVYLARDRWLGRMVALKEAHDEGLARRLAGEVRVTAGLEHPGIVTVYDEGQGADGRPFYTMRLMRGRPLSQLLAERPGVGERMGLLAHYLDACQALAYAHAQGVIHRDLKPANIMVGAFGETQVVDWGLARRLGDGGEGAGDAGATRRGAIVGTPAYMSPEQARGEPADRRSDVWGLGAVLHELLLGCPPRGAAAVVGERSALREVPAELAAIAERALAEAPAARYADAAALAADVAAYLEGRRVQAHRYTRLELALRFVRAWRGPLLVAGAAVIVIAVLLVLGNLSLRAQRDRAVAAETEVRAALAASDRNLATALVAQARAADDRRDNAAMEVLAAQALGLVDSPAARGLLAGARAAARPTRLASAALPDCHMLVALTVDDILCGDDHSLRRLTGGIERWRVRTEKLTRELRVEAGKVWVVSAGFLLSALSLATGEADDEAWELIDFNVGDAWPVRAAARGGSLTQPQLLGICGDIPLVGLSGLLDGRYAVLCGDGRVGVATGMAAPRFTAALEPRDFVSFAHLALAADARWAVVAGVQGRVAVREFATGRTWTLAADRPNPVRQVVIGPDGGRLAIVRERGGVEVFTLPELQPLGTIAGAKARAVRLFGDGSVLVASAAEVTQWALPAAPRPRVFTDEHGLSGVSFAPDGASLVTTHGEGRALVWDRASGLRRHELEIGSGTVKASAFLPDGVRVAIVDAGAGPPGPHIFSTATGEPLWSPPAPLLAEWRRGRGQVIVPGQELPLMGRRVVALADNVLVFSSYGAGFFAVDVDTGEDVPAIDCPLVEWPDIAGAPDHSRAVMVSVDATVYVLAAGDPLRCRPVVAPAGATTADVSNDGRTVIVGGSRFLARSGPEGVRWKVAHAGPWPLDVALSPDERWVASAGPQGVAQVWDAETGALRAVLTGHGGRVAGVEFSRDSATLATASWDGTARLWDLATLDASVDAIVRDAEALWGLSSADALDR
ncbi:MAG: protein kinase [Nannocystis sp.]|uniref:WD40 repeat domain-containing serine/threonine-protein kinase n=1 Tax=Nannocystis sp. TaxID=1962667 RepID=UPI002421E0D4|nr:WD40 repeat domain-containing serine/threonine-protein kinase [Nannocystis sp.]MBK9754474.1 protein kinase [Nannocystis sp.]